MGLEEINGHEPMRTENELIELCKILKEKDNFILATHLNYDPDALGSLISLGIILKKLNKNFLFILKRKFIPNFNLYL
jgi:nanoRNase/pAp phosphatase (c-di-AMP/oligoRNAs hydrolase)